MAINEFFTWGAGGTKKTPEQVAREREIAESILMRAGNTSPVGHWTQGAARIVDALGGVLKERRAAAGEADIASRNKTLVASLLGGGSPASSAPVSSSAIPMTSAAGEMAATSPTQPIDMTGNEVYNEFIGAAREGGLTNPFGLAALAATGKAESGFDPSNVNRTWSDPSESGQPGTAGGILSWRGPRYQALAATGDLSPRGQGNFFIQESPQLIAALNNAKSIEEAQSLINNAWQFAGFDRPGGEAARRLQLARGFLPSFQGAGEVAAATPEAAIEAVSPLQPAPEAAMSFAGQERAPPVSLSDEVAAYQQTPEYAAVFPGRQQPAQAAAAAPVQVAGGGDRVPMAATGTPGINPAIIEALTDPQASPQTQRIAGILLEQQQRQAQAAEEQRLQAADPLRQLQLQKGQLELEQMRQPQRQPLINAGDGRLYDPNTSQWLQAPGGGSEFRRATPEEAQQFGAAAGQFGPDNRFYPQNPPQGTSLSVDPATGAVTFNQGAGVKPLTEAQSKDTLYATRATNALPLVDKYEGELLSLSGNLAEGIPLNLGNYAQSEQYQVARDAGRDFLATILRKDTGAAITKNEEDIYGKMFLPQPGDKPAAIQAKRQRRALAVEAIKAGMPATAIENMAKALESVPSSLEIQTDIPGVKIRRKN